MEKKMTEQELENKINAVYLALKQFREQAVTDPASAVALERARRVLILTALDA